MTKLMRIPPAAPAAGQTRSVGGGKPTFGEALDALTRMVGYVSFSHDVAEEEPYVLTLKYRGTYIRQSGRTSLEALTRAMQLLTR